MCIFYGYITELQDSIQNGVHILDVEVSSFSIKLDYVKKSRSFQDIEMSYAAVAEHILSDYSGAVVKWENSGESSIGMPLFQYEETDWEFMKRIASNLNQGIISNVYVGIPYFYIDLQYDCAKTLEEYQYLEFGVLEDAFETGSDTYEGKQREYEYHRILCNTDYRLGSLVKIDEGVFRIVKKDIVFVEGELHFYYILAGESAFLQKNTVNEKLCGLQLSGKVIEIKQDKVKVSLDIDKKGNGVGEYFFDWHPDSSSIMYTMPEDGEMVNLYIGGVEGQNTAVINCMRENGSICEDTSLPENKMFQYQSEKMKLFPEKISFTLNEGLDSSALLEILDVDGIVGQVMKQVQVNAQEAVLLNSKVGKVNIKTPCQIELKDISEEGATLSINQTIECFGKDVEIQAFERIEYDPFNDAPVAIKKDWKKLALKVLAAVVIVAAVAVVAAGIAAATGGAAIAAMGVVVKTALIGGGVCALFAVGGQIANDVQSETKREFLDYICMGIDQFCTGAILAAPMALPIPQKYELVGVLIGTGFCSLGYQWTDAKLDNSYGGDFYDEDSNMYWTLFTDILFAGIGKGITDGLKKCFKQLTGRLLRISKADVRKLLPYWNKVPFLEKIPTSNAEINHTAKETMRRELGKISKKLAESKIINFLILGGLDGIDGKPGKPGADIPTTAVTNLLNDLLNGIFNDVIYGDDYDESYSDYYRVNYSNNDIDIIDFDENGNLVFE